MPFEITPKVAMEVIVHEAIVRQAYRDSVRVWTWSVGLTNATGHNVERYIDNPQPMERCIEVYLWALDNYADDVRQRFKGHSLTEAQFAAALSFHWNTGAILTASWVKSFLSGDMADAERRFMLWKNPPEILSRRKKEADLLFRSVWSSDGKATEYTRVTSGYSPVWSSAVRVDVEGIIRSKLGEPDDAEPSGKPSVEGWPQTALDRLTQIEICTSDLRNQIEGMS